MSNELLAKAGEVIDQKAKDSKYCVLSLLNDEGYPTTSTVTISKADGLKWLTFCTEVDSNKAKRIHRDNRACVCLYDNKYNITLVGKAEVITDPEVKKEMWFDVLKYHYSGPEDHNYCVIRFESEHYNIQMGNDEAKGTMKM